MRKSKQLAKQQRKQAKIKPDIDGRYDNIVQYLDQQEAELLAHDKRVKLTKAEEKRLNLYFIIFGMLIDGKSSTQVAARISKLYDFTRAYAFTLIGEAQKIFVQINKFDKEAFRTLQIERRERLIQQVKADTTLEESDRFKLINEIYREMERIRGLHRDDELSINELVEKLQMPETTFTTNPDALDTTYEEIK